MMVIYPAIFTELKDEKNTVLVYVPDLDRATEGFGIENAYKMARDCIGSILLETPDSEFPQSSNVKDVDVNSSEFAQSGNSFVSLVDVDIEEIRRREKSKVVRRNITLPQWLDEMATKSKVNVSAITQKALQEKFGIV